MTDINDYKEYNVTGYTHGILVYARNVREARRTFRRSYPNEKIFYSKLAGKINPKHI